MPAPHAEIWAALALLPLVFYASALSRGKAAPKFRSPYAPYALFACTLAAVYFSGGIASPLFGAYGLLVMAVAVLGSFRQALILAAIASLAEFALSKRLPDPPSLSPLALPWAGLVLGRFLGLFKPSLVLQPSEIPRAQQSAKVQTSSLEAVPEFDTSEMVDKNASAVLDIAHHSHPSWNCILLLWKDGKVLRYKQARTRQGALRTDFVVEEGDGLLGLALRDKRRVVVPNLPASTAAALPYYEGEVLAKAILVTPFFDEGELLGLLVVDKSEAAEWSPDEEQSADFLGRQIVQQTQMAGTFGRVQTQGKQVDILNGISKELLDDLDRDSLIAKMPALLGRLLDYSSFYLAMRDEGDEFSVVVSKGYAADFQGTYRLSESTVLGGWVLNSGEPLSYNASRAGASVPQFLSEGLDREAGNFLLVPLMRKSQVLGLLKIDRDGEEAFTDADKEVALIFASQAAVTLEHARLYTLHKRMATTDGLTGLYNHRYFQERLATELATSERTGKPLSLALTDIDLFKKFNDTFGHQEGDNVLRKCSKLLRDTVRQNKDVVCRYGGEEFVIIMPDCDLVEARQVVEGVRRACADTLIGGSGPEARPITLSVGLCSYPLGAKEQRDIIHKADEALYKAKQTGRNRTCSFKDLP